MNIGFSSEACTSTSAKNSFHQSRCKISPILAWGITSSSQDQSLITQKHTKLTIWHQCNESRALDHATAPEQHFHIPVRWQRKVVPQHSHCCQQSDTTKLVSGAGRIYGNAKDHTLKCPTPMYPGRSEILSPFLNTACAKPSVDISLVVACVESSLFRARKFFLSHTIALALINNAMR